MAGMKPESWSALKWWPWRASRHLTQVLFIAAAVAVTAMLRAHDVAVNTYLMTVVVSVAFVIADRLGLRVVVALLRRSS
jgi:hypothetical protein